MANAVEIRPANSCDAEPFRKMHLALCAEIYPGYTEQWILSSEGENYLSQRLAGNGLALIATVDQKVAGYLLGGLRASSHGINIAGVESIYVVAGLRRRAVGTELIKEFLRWFGESGLTRASVAVQPANTAARRLYLKAGFVEHEMIEDGRTLVLKIDQPTAAT